MTTSDYHRGRRPANAGQTYRKDRLTRTEAEALLGAFSRRGSAGIRNAAMTGLQLHTGVRIGEVVKAPLLDLDLDEATFYVRYPKRDRKGRAWPRTVGLDTETIALLERWLARRRSLGIPPRSGPLFCQVQQPRRGLRCTRSGYAEALKDAAARAGIARRVHPHMLRHTFAYQWDADGLSLLKLMKILGHKDLATTQHYVDHLNPKETLDAMRERGRPAPVAPDLLEALRTALADPSIRELLRAA